MKNITIGGKYKHEYGDTPGPGHYNESHKHTKAKVTSATIHPESPIRKSVEVTNGPGTYDYKHGSFGHDMKNVTIGGKYVTQYD